MISMQCEHNIESMGIELSKMYIWSYFFKEKSAKDGRVEVYQHPRHFTSNVKYERALQYTFWLVLTWKMEF